MSLTKPIYLLLYPRNDERYRFYQNNNTKKKIFIDESKVEMPVGRRFNMYYK